MSYISISYAGTRDDVDRIARLAKVLGVNMGELVCNAVDVVYGEQLENLEKFSAGLRGQQKRRSINTLPDNSGHRKEKAR